MSASSTAPTWTIRAGLLEGTGKRMRHVKLRWGEPVNETALHALIVAAYRDMQARLKV